MRNTRYNGYLGHRRPRAEQLERVRHVIREELTELQRYTLIAYYLKEQNLVEIAEERGVNRSTVSRTLRRAEEKLRRFLKY